MAGFRVSRIASQRLDEIFSYTRETWGAEQAESYIRSLFGCFEGIASRDLPWRAIPTEFAVDGFYRRHEHHVVYWRVLADGALGIVTMLHERMHQIDRFRDDVRG